MTFVLFVLSRYSLFAVTSIFVVFVILYALTLFYFFDAIVGQSDLPVLSGQNDLHFSKRFLITGAAGFIGFHVAKRLAHDNSSLVIAFDNFNNYYDVRLKIDRAFLLSKVGVIVYKDDLCNGKFLHELMTKYNFTHVIHLAAQAGVRYSLVDPLAYVTANFECHLVLLETLKQFQSTKLIYASSSSVYGKKSQVPFGHHSNTMTPGNLYAATKKADELLSGVYCHLHSLTAVGLRFFTVYGPWGRPDMAIYKFAELMRKGQEVTLYQNSGKETLERDFTYIDDVVSGIVSSVDYQPTSCGETFNLGFGRPVSILEMIKILERELRIQAKLKQLEVPATEILQTWANISETVDKLHYHPKTSLENGIRKFAVWYKNYLLSRSDSSQNEEKRKWFQRIKDEQNQRSGSSKDLKNEMLLFL